MHAVEGDSISSDQFLIPLNINKINIGSYENPKFTNIGDYWDDETVWKIINLLHQFQDLFSIMFSEIKGIVNHLGEMNIPLRPNTKLVKQ